MTDLTTVELLWKLLPAALVVPFITFALGRLGNGADRKLEYRTFVDVGEVTANYKLKNMPNLKSGTKLITPKEYSSLEKEIEKRIKTNRLNPTTVQLIYLKVKTFGKSIVTSGTIGIKMRSADKTDSWSLDISLPILEPNEEIYIPLDRLDKYEVEYYVEEVRVKYRTQSGERIFYRNLSQKNAYDKTVTINSYKVKKFNLFYFAIDKNKGRNAGWIFLDNDKDKKSS
ncbi:hypothetical protein [Priestia megaterium]|uniref:hypothetical protein n=1 Tax=Priestia megaterium TaxID=1404 RepID=UPI0011457A66|nr:hypothetical protein [Priestia megaterium]